MDAPLRYRQQTVARMGLSVIILVALACGETTQPEPDRTPTITITGVEDGEVAQAPVTIVIEVDVGTYVAELNGEAFFSGRTVSDPGSYLLEVAARNGTATASESVQFVIALAGSSRLILRALNLGPNNAGGGGDALLLWAYLEG